MTRSALLLPFRDGLAALEAVLPARPWKALALIAAGVLLGWWIYVPVHELLHVAGCRLTGGSVTRLELDPIYGARLLERWLPFVEVGSDRAGRLSGFDTGGSDLVYLVTVFAPYLLTVLIGVPMLRARARARRERAGRARDAILLGLALPVAYAPLTNLTGDFYELGSILVSDALTAIGWNVGSPHWRSDDFLQVLRQADGAWDVAGPVAAFVVGTALAWATYLAGAGISRVLR